MISYTADMIAIVAAGVALLNAHTSRVHSQRSDRNAAACARRCAECHARNPAPLEADRSAAVPGRRLSVVRVLHTDSDEARERLVDGARQRHPQSSPGDRETVPPAQADALRAPGGTPKP